MRRGWLILIVPAVFTVMSIAAESTVADAAMQGDWVRLRSLVTRKADVNQAQVDGTTALHWAVRQDNLEMVNLLIAAGRT